MPETPAPRRYAAFVSYRHSDNREAGRRWAEWLHHELETYEVPPDLVGKQNLRGEPIPASLYPVFRDEEELPADADLSQNIRRALENSASLVVLCSPRSRSSRFVDAEIREFKEMGKCDRILAVMIDGEPNADEPDRAALGILPEMECLPEALRFGVPASGGGVDWSRPSEPIAADTRPGGRPEQGYTTAAGYAESLRRAGGRSGREVAALQREYAARLDLARLKVVAGVLGVPLGQLRARDAVYRARRLRRLALTFGSLALVALVAAVVAIWQGLRAESNFQQAESARRVQAEQLVEASRHAHAAAERELRAGNWRRGIALLGRALRYHRKNEAAAAHLWSALAYGTGDRDEPPLAAWEVGAPVEALGASPDGRLLAVATAEPRLLVLDLASGRTRAAPLPPGGYPRGLRFSPSAGRLVFTVGILECHLAAWEEGSETLRVVRLAGDLHDAAFAADGSAILAFGVLGGPLRFDPDTGGALAEPSGPRSLGAVFSADGRYLLRAAEDRRFELLDLAGGPRPVLGDLPSDLPLDRALLGPGARHLALPGTGGPGVWEVATGRRVLGPAEGVGLWPGLAIASEDALVSVNGGDGSLEVWDLGREQRLDPVLRHAESPVRCAFAPTGTRIHTGGADGVVASWATPSGSTGGPRRIAAGPVEGVHWLGSDRVVLVGATSVEVRAVADDRPAVAIPSGPCPGGAAAPPRGDWLATGGPGGRIRVWDPGSGRMLAELQGPPLDIYRLVPSPDGARLLVSGYDLSDGSLVQCLRVFDALGGGAVGPEIRTPRLAVRVGLTREGARVVAALDLAGPWFAWDAATGESLPEVAAEDRAALLTSERRERIGELAVPSGAPPGSSRAILDSETRLPRTEPLGDRGSQATWSPDGRHALAFQSDRSVALYETPAPGPPGEWLDDFVAAAGGLSLTESGVGRPLAVLDRWRARRRLVAAPIDDPDWARLLRWWLAGPDRARTGP